MQPQQQKPDYNFILKEENKSKKQLFNFANLSRTSLILAVSAGIIVILIIVGAIAGHNKKNAPSLVEVIGRSQEINRVSAEQNNLKDPTALTLSATSQQALASDQVQLKAYAKKHKIKIDAKKLALYNDKSVDAQLTAATQNNNLDNAYINYMRQALNTYSDSLKSTFASSKDDSLRAILKESYASSQTLLSTAPLKQ